MSDEKAEPYEVDAQGLTEAIAADVRAEQGDDVQVQGFVTVALYARQDGSSGLVIRSTTASAALTSGMLTTAAGLVDGQVAEIDEADVQTIGA